MDETRFGRPRWLSDGEHDDGRVRWVRSDPWETGFVDITGEQSLLGQVDGRTSAAVQAWLAARTAAFRADPRGQSSVRHRHRRLRHWHEGVSREVCKPRVDQDRPL